MLVVLLQAASTHSGPALGKPRVALLWARKWRVLVPHIRVSRTALGFERVRVSDADADADADAADNDDGPNDGDDDDDTVPSKPFAAWRSCSLLLLLSPALAPHPGSSTGATSWCEPV